MNGIGIVINKDTDELAITDIDGKIIEEGSDEHREFMSRLDVRDIKQKLMMDYRISGNDYLVEHIEELAEYFYVERDNLVEKLNDEILRLALSDLDANYEEEEDYEG